MAKVIVSGLSLSIDGFGAGPKQTLDNPLGTRGMELHDWLFATKAFRTMIGQGGGSEGIDEAHAARAIDGFGPFMLGRNMFVPFRGGWPNEDWKGWWGNNPPYRAPTFVLTHHPRGSIEIEGGTTFHFVTDGIGAALDQAKAAAGERNVKIDGGVSTVRQYLQSGSVDEVHFAVAPFVLGKGEAMFTGVDLPVLGFSVTEHVASDAATHFVLSRQEEGGAIMPKFITID